MNLPTPARRLLAALPDLTLAGLFAAVWLRPARFEPGMPGHLSLLMMFEFVLMHAGIALLALADAGRGMAALHPGDDARRAKRLYLMVGAAMAAYLVFSLFFVVSFDTLWPLLALLATFAAKAGGLLAQAAPADLDRDRLLLLSLGCVVAYLGAFFATSSVPSIPALGFAGLPPMDPPLPGFPVWQEAPQRLCAYGVAYFAACAAMRALAVQRTP